MNYNRLWDSLSLVTTIRVSCACHFVSPSVRCFPSSLYSYLISVPLQLVPFVRSSMLYVKTTHRCRIGGPHRRIKHNGTPSPHYINCPIIKAFDLLRRILSVGTFDMFFCQADVADVRSCFCHVMKSDETVHVHAFSSEILHMMNYFEPQRLAAAGFGGADDSSSLNYGRPFTMVLPCKVVFGFG